MSPTDAVKLMRDALASIAKRSSRFTEGNEAQAALDATAVIEQPVAPIAWASFVENGNCRIWFSNQESAEKWGRKNNLTLVPLYATPQSNVQPTLEITKKAKVATDGSIG